MSLIEGSVPVTGFIAPTESGDTHPTHSEEYGRGGYRSVDSIMDRDAIPNARRTEGMLVYVKQPIDKTYKLKGGTRNANWSLESSSTVVIDNSGSGELTAEQIEVLLNRENHNGQQEINTITGLTQQLAARAKTQDLLSLEQAIIELTEEVSSCVKDLDLGTL